ncbi:MAG: outer membrane protein assembly factor BamD [Hydrogenobacter thermophilus]|uniref:outer membrane protein assembly factor BamD n=1 Tax=Hydrogenobacter thermophilus TaxID=940 RepID=UPI000CB2E747|nr:outer membrane protein assembly factor BamD [Hydrogenobacter thermophilus]QWK18955.1 MAG: outer membrane protein assembly factor BamD [Hydrogenobacter thermophilus]GBC88372.1 Outer membrane protein assembly factor BamD [bacterium HR13]
MKRILFITLLALVFGCAKMTEEKRAKLAIEYYQEGMVAYANRDYSKAVERLKEALKYLENLTPQQIKDAKYVIAESYYMNKDYINAVVYFEDFLFYYPEVPESEKAYFMLVDSYMKVAPDPYRDQTYTLKAIDKAKDFLSRFPQSPYAERVRAIMEDAQRKLARHEYLIGRFYEDFGYYYSASLRYRDLLINYPEQVSDVEVSFRYIKSLLLVRLQAKREEEKYRKWIEEAQKHLKDAKSEEDKRAIQRRIDFLEGEIQRWKKLAEESYEDGLKNMERYKSIYGENTYYRELKKYVKR